MRSHGHNPLLKRCIECPAAVPKCNCAADQQCTITSTGCDSCASVVCTTIPKASSGGTSKGAMAGAVVGILIFLFLVVGGFLWWRRRSHIRKLVAANREKAGGENITGTPSPAPGAGLTYGTVRGAPDAVEKPERGVTPGGHSDNMLDVDPFMDNSRPGSERSGQSGQSIPIGFASEGSTTPGAGLSPTGTAFTAPQRPQRSPELTLRSGTSYLDRPVSATLQPPRPGYAPSQRSAFTTSSMGSNASSVMDALYESPTIVSAGQRQVLGAVRAEVVQVGGLHSPLSPRSQPRGSQIRSQPGPSPLASSHFTGTFPTIEEDPFGDQASLRTIASDMTFGTPLASSHVNSGVTTQTAQRVMLRGQSVASATSLAPDASHPLATGSSLSLTPSNNESAKDAAYDVYYNPSRASQESFVSQSDSVLASFPFVPPSPLPSTQTRSPLSVVFNPNRQSIASSVASGQSGRPPPTPTSEGAQTITMNSQRGYAMPSPRADDPSPSFRQSSAASTMSRGSTSSSGLDAFQFHFADGDEEPALPPLNPAFFGHSANNSSVSSLQARRAVQAVEEERRGAAAAGTAAAVPARQSEDENNAASRNGGQGQPRQDYRDRASLDTLALSRDLAANRLSYD